MPKVRQTKGCHCFSLENWASQVDQILVQAEPETVLTIGPVETIIEMTQAALAGDVQSQSEWIDSLQWGLDVSQEDGDQAKAEFY